MTSRRRRPPDPAPEKCRLCRARGITTYLSHDAHHDVSWCHVCDGDPPGLSPVHPDNRR